MQAIVPVISLLLALAALGDEEMDDEELARRISGGDRTAFRAFFDRYHGLLFGYLRRRGVGPAASEDLVQQAFVTVWEKRADIDPSRSLRSFLFKIGYNRALNHFRDRAKFIGDDGLADEPAPANPEASAEHALLRERLLEAVKTLPERRRAVFELCFLEDLTYREAADVLDISIKTVENQMAAALKTIRKAFADYEEIYRRS